MQGKKRLGVNIDHVATLRNARGEGYPNLIHAAEIAIQAGADGITAHLREDRRHIRDEDVFLLKEKLSVPLNLEMAATEEMVGVAQRLRPHACCIVPERREELTTEGGLDVLALKERLKEQIPLLQQAGVRVSLFVAPNDRQLEMAAQLGADVVELHTGVYSHAPAQELSVIAKAARKAYQLGLEVHAGHGLTFGNVAAIAALPEVQELNIGHFIIAQSVFDGLSAVVHHMKHLITNAENENTSLL
ncbi:pyridoxine 5'-phosphate synthase [Entomobacter blattae]|uniref:Pyridoxine 5'-phosphate synthase n=1 Tax=Entomobacter blattae TaxID=2762277 RepID=A0A7H1NPG5_9PROT|nr:pyridoxine 5'-phosphate synthase [Entomobacter blattae]QNT77675.1 Pyridoxine 5'-phosphate synthase [Entomobacter blattae]